MSIKRTTKIAVSLVLIATITLASYSAVRYYLTHAKAAQFAAGEKLYNAGLDASGEPVQGQTEGDIEFKDAHFNCAQCHRRSGYGSSEGGNYVLPITRASLFNTRSFDRTDLFNKLFKENQSKLFWARMRSAYQRPGYTEETLAKAIRDGIDPSGRKLNPLMPRYRIGDRDMAALIAYLKKLSAENDPGVDKQTIYFATVVGKGADAQQRNAMLSTIGEYVKWLNHETQGNQNHPNFSPNYRSDFAKGFRLWQHEVWELSENPAHWAEELQAHYNKKPVFALIGGMADGDWTPIHHFCEQNRVPCLFPFTELPAQAQPGHYSLYFNGGLILEARALAKQLFKERQARQPAPLLQVFPAKEDAGLIPARAFKTTLKPENTPEYAEIAFSTIEDFQKSWAAYRQDHSNMGDIVIWPGAFKTALLEALAAHAERIGRVFLPSSLVHADLSALPRTFAEKLIFVYPYALPGDYQPHAFRVRAWMNTRRLPITDVGIQFNTYYALNLLQYGLEPIVDHFSRDYLLEYIEHEAENAINPGVFPRLSLGPEQRFASKGAYLVRLDESHAITQVSDWIVP